MADDVIKSLKWLIFNFPEIENPKDDAAKISNCIHLYCQNAVDELNRQKAEIERLQENEQIATAVIVESSAEIENLQHYKSLYEGLKAEHLETVRLIKTAETEAVKRFAKKLVALDDIEKITKEMLGDTE